MLKNDGGRAFGIAVDFMTTNPLIKVMEVVLMSGFLIHILMGIILQIQNWLSRPVRYKVEGYSHKSFFSKYMIHTGLLVLIFLIIHFINFYFIKLGIVAAPEGVETHNFYDIARILFANGYYVILYTILMVFLGFHLNHAFQSAFMSMGLEHSKYTPAIKIIGSIYSIIVPLGFALIPIIIHFS